MNNHSERQKRAGQKSDPKNGPEDDAAQTRRQSDDTLSKVSDAAQNAAGIAKDAAAQAGSTIADHVKDLLDGQLANGADIIGHFGRSAHRAAEDLDDDAPQLADLVRGVADRIDSYADDLRDQSVDDLYRTASNYTRRQPALVFGLAALAGFFAFRTIKSARPAPQPNRGPRPSQSGGQYYGA